MTDPFAESLSSPTDSLSWRPSPGEAIIGKLVTVQTVTTKYGPTEVATLAAEPDERPVCVWLSSAMLKDEWQRAAPRPGERVGVRFVGLKVGRQGQQYKQFTVRVDRSPGAPKPVDAPPPAETEPTETPF